MADRRAFERRLDELQALQFRLPDMATELEVTRTLLWRATDVLGRRTAEAPRLCAMAKRFATTPGSASPATRCSCMGAKAI